jgi:hypothetical protein
MASETSTENTKSIKPVGIEVGANLNEVERGPLSPVSWRIAPEPKMNSRKNTDLDDYFVCASTDAFYSIS